MKIRKEYYKAIKKYGTQKVLEMYRDDKIKLNDKEWDNLHKRIEKENRKHYFYTNPFIINFIICCLIVIIAGIFMNTNNHEKIKKCNELKGHICSRYEIESMGD